MSENAAWGFCIWSVAQWTSVAKGSFCFNDVMVPEVIGCVKGVIFEVDEKNGCDE